MPEAIVDEDKGTRDKDAQEALMKDKYGEEIDENAGTNMRFEPCLRQLCSVRFRVC